ncbi:GTP-binding protein, partial [Helicobacter pylori]|uniref:GTP-binding protein n=1 Tax=Helicobacter pylori TaxID=210 RepID=UPI002444C4A9
MPKIPITLITGFLGSGKTSFLSEYLNQIDHQGVALIINEIGQAALDQRILSVQYCDEKMLYLNAGCACCNKRLDLVESLKATLNNYEWHGEILRRIIIETTGLANPAPILWTILSDTFLGAHFEIQSVVACV